MTEPAEHRFITKQANPKAGAFGFVSIAYKHAT